MMKPKDAQYLDEMVKLIESANFKLLTEENDFLIKHGAMNEAGDILCEYPKVAYLKNGDKVTLDEGGNMIGLNVKLEQLKENGVHAWIEYYPRFMSFFVEAKKIIRDKQYN